MNSFQFLGLRKLQPDKMQQHLAASHKVNALKPSVKESFGPMKEETKALLKAVYAPFNKAFAAMVGNPELAYE